MADINLKTVTALSSRDTVVNVILEYNDGGTLKLGKATIGAILAGLTSAADHAALVARVAALEAAAGGGGETLPAITASPSSPSFVAGAAAGTSIATLSAVPSGATRTISGDGRVVLDSAKTALVVGLTAASAGTTVSVTVTDTKAGATNSPVSTTITISVTASGTVTRYLATNMAEATMPNTQPAGSGANELTRRRTFYLPVAMDDLEFTFSNTTVNADGTVTGAPAFTAFGASLRLASSSAAPVQGSFSGSTEIALASGAQATCVFTGPFAAGLYEYRAYTKKTDSTAFRGSYATANGDTGGGWLAGKHLVDTSFGASGTNAAPFTPIAIKGKPSSSAKPVSFLLYGDSIATGFYDSSNSADGNGDLGGFSKGITAAGAAHARFTTPSMSMRTAASTACRAALLAQLQAAKPDYILDQMGVNDFYQDAVSLADYQTRKNAFWDWCVTNGYSGKVIATTVTPSNGTADAARQSANTWLLTKPHAALYAVWDVAAAMTGSTTGSAYTAGLSDDALHPNSSGHNTLKTFIQGKVAALASGGGTVVTPSRWSTTDKTALAVIGGTSNDTATIQGNGTDTQSYQYAVLETRIVGNADTVVGFNISGTFDGSDFALVFCRRSDYAQAGFADAVPNSFVIRLTEGLAHVDGAQVGIWQGTGVDASKVLVPIKRSGGVNKVAYRFATMDWLVNQPTVNIQTGDGMLDGSAAWGSDDLCVMLVQIFVGPTNSMAAQVISTADGLASAFPGVTLTGYTPIAGAGSSSGGDGGTTTPPGVMTGFDVFPAPVVAKTGGQTGGWNQSTTLYRGQVGSYQAQTGSITPRRAANIEVGGNLHTDEVDYTGGNAAKSIANLKAMGATCARLSAAAGGSIAAAVDFAQQIIAAIPGFRIIPHAGYNDGTAANTLIAFANAIGAANVAAFSQTNEIDGPGKPGDPYAGSYAYGVDLWNAVQADANLKKIPIFAPSFIGAVNAAKRVAGLGGYVNGGEIHSYTGVRQPNNTGWGGSQTNDGVTLNEGSIKFNQIYAAKSVSGLDYYFAGECGYPTSNDGIYGGVDGNGQPWWGYAEVSDPTVYAHYMLWDIIDHFNRGVNFMTFYSLNDKWNREAGPEPHFGLFQGSSGNTTTTAKSAVAGIKRLMDILKDTATDARTFKPAAANLTVGGDLATVSYPSGFDKYGYGSERGVESLWVRHRTRGTLIGIFHQAAPMWTLEKAASDTANTGPTIPTVYAGPPDRTITITPPGGATISNFRAINLMNSNGWQTNNARMALSNNVINLTLNRDTVAVEFQGV